MSFPRYPSYKDSGVEWLGEVPAHWDVSPCRAIVHEQTAKNNDAKCDDYLSLMANVGIIPYAEKGDVGNKKPEDLSKCKIVTRGDFVINSMNYGIGLYGLSDYDGVCSPVYIVLKPQNDVVESRFAFRIFENRAFQTFAQSFGNGILEHRCAINWDILKPIGVAVPPIDEQAIILEFLDRETGKIDELVAQQRRLMELLNEKRQAVISHAVARGLNPAVPLKPSGDHLLGDVPEHWTVKRLRNAVQIDNGPRFPINRSERADVRGEYPYWGPTGILDSLDHYRYEGERALIGEDGDHFNKYAEWPMTQWASGRFNVNNHAHVIASGATCLARWFYFAFMHRDICADLITQGVSRLKLRRETLSNLLIACPPLDEQVTIITELEKIVDQTSDAVRRIEEVIGLLQERRTALISAAVTGQIDVRKSL